MDEEINRELAEEMVAEYSDWKPDPDNWGEPAWSDLPWAPKSSGPIIRNCALCYFSNEHCGYHGMPDHFDNAKSEDRYARIKTSGLVALMNHADYMIKERMYGNARGICKKGMVDIARVQMHLGWPEPQDDVWVALESDNTGSGKMEKKSDWQVRGDKRGLDIWDFIGAYLCRKYGPRSGRWDNAISSLDG